MEQQGALQVKKGQPVEISFDSIRQTTFHGVVEAVYSYDVNFLARIGVSGLTPNILPGMSADVAIQVAKHDSALLMPIAAYDKGYVWVKRGGHGLPKLTPVKLGIVDKDMAEIVSGNVHAGDRLVIKRKLN